MAQGDLHVTERIVIPATDLEYEHARASGPGGQSVNTTDSAVRLRFAFARSTAISEGVKERITVLRGRLINKEGELLIHAERFRSRQMNLDDARERLAALIRECLTPPKPRRPTKPTRSSQTRRVTGKRERSSVKASRGKVSRDD